jgi:membrane protein required for colicin V production
MQGYDLFMLIVLLAAVAWGAWKGLAWQLASMASIALSYFVALNFRTPLAAVLSKSVELKPPLDIFLAMLILFMGSSLLVWVGFNLVSEVIERVKLKEFDHQFGAILGFAKGVLLCIVITLFAITLAGEPQQQSICNSRSGYYIAMLLDRADPVMPKELHQVLEPYLRNLEENVPHQHTQHTAGQPIIAVPNPNQFSAEPSSQPSSQPAPSPSFQPQSFYDPRTVERLQNQFAPAPQDDMRR